MFISQIQLSKSKTIGFQTKDGRTKFKKIQIMVIGDLRYGEKTDPAYKKLSEFIEKQLEYEQSKNK